MAKRLRQQGDPIRINLSGSLADAVAHEAQKLGISFSAYVSLKLQGQLGQHESTGTVVTQQFDHEIFDISSLPSP